MTGTRFGMSSGDPGARRYRGAQSMPALLLALALNPWAYGDAEKSETPQVTPPDTSYATAMERRKPQERVRGGAADPLCDQAPTADPRLTDAVAYARAMDSYSLLVWQGGACALATYFAPHGPELRPESASMHKSVAALLVAAAIADGYIDSADDPVGRYLPQWREDPRGAIPLRDLLTMSSGLEPLSIEGGATSEASAFIMGEGDVLEILYGRAQAHDPGSVFHYQGINTQLLLLVLEAATGKPYIEYLSERLWQPLGARDAYVWLYDEAQRMPRAFIALMATAEDWLRVGLLLLQRGEVGGEQLLPAALIDEMSVPGKAYANYGWQLWLGREYEPMRHYTPDRRLPGFAAAEPFATDDMIYFDGFGGQRVYISRKLDLVIVRLGDMRRDWDDTRLPNLVIGALSGAPSP